MAGAVGTFRSKPAFPAVVVLQQQLRHLLVQAGLQALGGLLMQRPLHMFADKFRQMRRAVLQSRDGCWRIRGVAERHGDVSQPANVSRASDWRALGALEEFVLVPGEKLDQAAVVQRVTSAVVGLGTATGELVPGADQLAVVAAKDAIAHGSPQIRRYRATQLDGQVSDAAPCIDLIGGNNCLCRTDVDTAPACSAMLGRWRIEWQRQVGIELSEEKP
jgi:hypothetical protein